MPKKLRLITHNKKLLCSHPAAIFFPLVFIPKRQRKIHRSLRPLSVCGLSRSGFKSSPRVQIQCWTDAPNLQNMADIPVAGRPSPVSCPADLGRETLNPIEGFETTSRKCGEAEVIICN
jgi:hypothetical protein